MGAEFLQNYEKGKNWKIDEMRIRVQLGFLWHLKTVQLLSHLTFKTLSWHKPHLLWNKT